jgi:hypothetical protein
LAALFFLALIIFGAVRCVPKEPRSAKPVSQAIHKPFPFNPGDKFLYEVTFNRLKAGTIELEYKGRKDDLDLVVVTNKINVLNILQINSVESIYLNAEDYLPKKVERDVVFFGKPEHIIEEYNQKDGWVNVLQEKNGKTKENIIPQDPPIHNSHSLFFVYPLNFEQDPGALLEFNLPLEKVKMRVRELRKVKSDSGEKEVYVLEVNPKKIVIVLDKSQRIPLRIEMPCLWSKLVIKKK